tara:strand:+ start:1100 stop:1237 length:138 start_codon:yes stop_codon:yes gene_type:complete
MKYKRSGWVINTKASVILIDFFSKSDIIHVIAAKRKRTKKITDKK